MERLFAESRAALARGTPRPRNTKDRPVGGLHVPADRGRSKRLATLILPDNPPSRQVENAGFDNGGAMSHVRCPFAASFPARRGSRARSSTRRGVDRRVPTASPTHIPTL